MIRVVWRRVTVVIGQHDRWIDFVSGFNHVGDAPPGRIVSHPFVVNINN